MQRTVPVACGLLLTVVGIGAFLLRAHDLDRRPMHHDEANQAVRCGEFLESGDYRYDPKEHHGPTLYFLTLPGAYVTGGGDFARTTEITYRMVPVLFGVGLILLLLLVVDGLGCVGVLTAAVLTAISPGMVYYNRFYIQESLLVFFSFAAIAAGWRYTRRRSGLWALLAGASVGLMHASKETCVITYLGMAAGLAVCVPALWGWFRGLDPSARRRMVGHAASWAVAAVLLSVLFFTVFFTRWRGAVDSIMTYAGYLGRAGGQDTEHIHPWTFYLRTYFWSRTPGLSPWSEGAIAVLAAVGVIGAFRSRGPERLLLRFLFAFTLCQLVVYSLIPYKTPWCGLSMLHGMILMAGGGVQWVFCSLPWGATVCTCEGRCVWKKNAARTSSATNPAARGSYALANAEDGTRNAEQRRTQCKTPALTRIGRAILPWLVVCAVLTAVVWQLWGVMWRANFVLPADPRNPYVYAQTSPDFLRLASRVNAIAEVAPTGRDMVIGVLTTPGEAWPLPWYLRGYRNVGYWTSPDEVPDTLRPAMWIASGSLEDGLRSRLGDEYQTEYYGLRPAVLLTVYIRRDLWDRFLEGRR